MSIQLLIPDGWLKTVFEIFYKFLFVISYSRLFWTDSASGTVEYIALDGSGDKIVFAENVAGAYGIAVFQVKNIYFVSPVILDL